VIFIVSSSYSMTLARGFYIENIKSPAYTALCATYARDVKYAVPPLLPGNIPRPLHSP